MSTTSQPERAPASAAGVRPSSRASRLSGVAVVAVLALASAAFRWEALSSLTTPLHDETISYVEASCHQSEWWAMVEARDAPFGRWTTAASWQRLWAVEDRFCFGRISGDLARTDIHPPLYFWLLHLWILAFGVTVRSGPTLNVVLSVATLLLIYGLGRHLSESRAAAAAGAWVWALSPATLAITIAARQYELLALASVAFCWQLLRISDPRREPAAWELLPLGLTVAGGLLTHYHFLILVAAGNLVAAWRLQRSGRRPYAVAAAICAGLLLAALVHPGWMASVARAREEAQSFAWAEVPMRALRVAARLSELAVTGIPRLVWLSAAAGAAAVLATLVRRRPRAGLSALDRSTLALFAIATLLVGAIAALYVSFVSPAHAMGPRYLSMVWPPMAVIVVALLWRRRWGRLVTTALCITLLLAAVSWRRQLPGAEASLLQDGPQPLLIDNVRRGILPRVLWQIAPGSVVYAADEGYLLEHDADWLDGLGDRAVFVSGIANRSSMPAYRNTEEGRRRLLEALSRDFTVIEGPRHSAESQSFFLRRKSGEAGSR